MPRVFFSGRGMHISGTKPRTAGDIIENLRMIDESKIPLDEYMKGYRNALMWCLGIDLAGGKEAN